MMLNYNYNMFSLMFNASCLAEHHISMLNNYEFIKVADFYKGHITVSNISTFILDFEDTTFLQDCLLLWDYEYLVPIDECISQSTTSIYYDQILKPDAWPLDYMDQSYDQHYAYSILNEDMVDLWMLDTGIFWNHKELEDLTITDEDPTYTILNITHPHGTGTCSAAAGKHYGTTKSIIIHNVPVCKYNGTCASSDIEKGFLQVMNHVALRNTTGKRSVINMSFGVSYGSNNPMNTLLGQYYNQIFQNITLLGGIIVVAAGNSNQNACNWLYSYSPFVISVGSIDQYYNKSSFSNYGSCVDLWTFGSNVPLAYSVKDPTVIQFKSGTSFASPYIAGLIVNLLRTDPTLTKDQILNLLYTKINNRIVSTYHCGQEYFKCCRGSLSGTRLDEYCKTYSIYLCPRSCILKPCTANETTLPIHR